MLLSKIDSLLVVAFAASGALLYQKVNPQAAVSRVSISYPKPRTAGNVLLQSVRKESAIETEGVSIDAKDYRPGIIRWKDGSARTLLAYAAEESGSFWLANGFEQPVVQPAGSLGEGVRWVSDLSAFRRVKRGSGSVSIEVSSTLIVKHSLPNGSDKAVFTITNRGSAPIKALPPVVSCSCYRAAYSQGSSAEIEADASEELMVWRGKGGGGNTESDGLRGQAELAGIWLTVVDPMQPGGDVVRVPVRAFWL